MVISMTNKDLGKMEEFILKSSISWLTILIPLMIAEEKIGLDNYIKDHSLKFYEMHWWFLIFLIPLTFSLLYNALIIYCPTKYSYINPVLRLLLASIFVIIFICLAKTSFPEGSEFDKTEFIYALFLFLSGTCLTIMIGRNFYDLWKWLRKK